MAIASHPAFGRPVQELEPVTMKFKIEKANKKRKRTLAPELVDQLQDVVTNHNVCGFVVNWPVQKEGRCGAPCGRVLHTLDSILAKSPSVLSSQRHFCLWDIEHVQQKEDEWGRAPTYSETSKKTLHIASLEQYSRESDSTTAADIWNDFCRSQWPELYQKQNEEELCGDYQITSSESDFLVASG